MTVKPISIPLTSIGHGALLSFNSSEEELGSRKHFELESVETEWLAPLLEELDLQGENQKHIQLSASVGLEGQIVRVKGSLNFRPMLECIRCLTRFRQDINTDLNGFFVDQSLERARHIDTHTFSGIKKKGSAGEEEGVEVGGEDFEVYQYRNRAVVLDELLLDTLQTAVPTHPLCSEDCKGLCVVCGESLNDKGRCPKENALEEPCPHFNVQ